MAIGELSATPSQTRAFRPGPSRRVAAGALGLGLALVLMGFLAALGAPLTVIAAGAGAILWLGLLARPRAATVLFVALLYANVPIVAATFHGVPGLVAVGAPLLLLGIPFMSYLLVRREDPVVTPTLGWLIAYLAVQIVSTIFSSDVQASVNVVATFASEGLLLYVLVTNAVRDWQTLRAVIVALLTVGAILGGLSVFQEVTGTYDNQYLGFAQTRELGALEPVDPDASQRLSGPIGEKNRYAQVMLILLPLALIGFQTAKTRRTRLLAAVSGIAILAGMLLTFSRGAGVALAALLVIAIALRYVKLVHALVVGATLVVAVTVFAPQYITRVASLEAIGSVLSGASNDADGAILGRATSNLASLNVFLDYPLIGVGPGEYVARYSQEYGNELGMRYRETSRRAHNMILEVAADTGIPGVVTLGGVFGATLIGLWRVRRKWLTTNPEYAAWAAAFLLAVIGYLLTSLFLHIAYMRYLWLLMALANSAIWILDREVATRRAGSPASLEPIAPSVMALSGRASR